MGILEMKRATASPSVVGLQTTQADSGESQTKIFGLVVRQPRR